MRQRFYAWLVLASVLGTGQCLSDEVTKETKPAVKRLVGVRQNAVVAPAVVVVGRAAGNNSPLAAPSSLLSDPSVSRRVGEAKQLLSEGEFDRGLYLLQGIFDTPETSFIRLEGKPPIRATQAAIEIIRSAPVEVLDRYGALYEDEATHLLGEADRARDPMRWGTVARRFPLTTAGQLSLERLGSYHLDAGRAALALHYFDERLANLKPGDPAGEMTRLKRNIALSLCSSAEINAEDLPAPSVQLALGGQPRPARGFLEAFLSESRARDEASVGTSDSSSKTASPLAKLPLLTPDWTVEVASESDIRSLLTNRAEEYAARRAPLVFGYRPVRLGDRLYFRNFDNIWSIDAVSGKKIASAKTPITRISQEMKRSQGQFQQAMVQTGGVEYTFVTNQVYGSLSTDGERIYAINNLSVNPLPFVPQVIGRQPNEEFAMRSRNSLIALDPTTLDRVWELGSSKGDAQIFFFGPPAAIGDRLYVIGESKSEISLYCIDGGSGKIDWKQILSISARSIDSDLFRRSQACHVTFADGVLLCPTNLFHLVAFDPMSRTRLWDLSLLDEERLPPQYLMAIQAVHPPANANPTDAPLVADGKALVWEPMGPSLLCVELATGRKLWRAERSGDWYMAGVSANNVILVGPTTVRAVSLKDGLDRWRTATPVPSGRGLILEDDLLLPTTDGRVLVVDLSKGQIKREVRDRSRRPVGTIVSYDRTVLAIGPDGLKSFPVAGAVREEFETLLAADPQSARGLYRRAQVALMAGQARDSVEDLRVAARDTRDSASATAARDLLFNVAAREAVAQPADYSQLVDDLERLAKDDGERGIFLRLKAEDSLKKGFVDAILASLDAHDGLKLAEPIPAENLNEWRSPSTWNRWFLSRTLRVLDRTKAASVLAVLNERIEKASSASDLEALRKLAFLLSDHPIGAHARFILADKLVAVGSLGEADALMQEAYLVQDDAVRQRAMTQLARIAEAAGHPEVARYYQRKNAHASIAPTAASPTNAPWMGPAKLVSSEKTYRPDSTRRILFPADYASPLFRDQIVTFDQQRWELQFVSADTGALDWKLTSLPKTQTYIQPLEYQQIGPILAFSQCNTVYAVSGYDRKLLWHRRFEETHRDFVEVMSSGGRLRLDARRSAGISPAISPWPIIGPAGPGFMVVRSGKRLVVLHPWTNEVLWTRTDVRPDQQVAGDHQYILLYSPDGSFTALRTSDGGEAASGNVGAELRYRKRLLGRRVLMFDNEGIPKKPRVIRLYDPVNKVDFWKRAVSATAEWKASTDELVLLLDRSRKLTVLRLEDGEVVLEDSLDPAVAGSAAENAIVSINLFSDGERVFIAANHAMLPGEQSWPISASPNMRTMPVHGWVRAYDIRSKKLLWHQSMRHRAFVTEPARELPVLLAVGARMMDVGDNKQLATTFEAIDKLTGKSLHVENHPQYGQMLDVVYSLRDRWVELRGFNVKIRLEFAEAGAEEAKTPAANVEQPPPPVDPAARDPRAMLKKLQERLRESREAKERDSKQTPASENRPK